MLALAYSPGTWEGEVEGSQVDPSLGDSAGRGLCIGSEKGPRGVRGTKAFLNIQKYHQSKQRTETLRVDVSG